jgi:hypothetical protein
VNFGAVSRGALVRENLERTPKVALVEVTESGVKVTGIPLQVAAPSEVFDLERKERMDTESNDIAQFVSHLQSSIAVDPSSTIEANVMQLEFARDVRDLALMYLERARSEVG